MYLTNSNHVLNIIRNGNKIINVYMYKINVYLYTQKTNMQEHKHLFNDSVTHIKTALHDHELKGHNTQKHQRGWVISNDKFI